MPNPLHSVLHSVLHWPQQGLMGLVRAYRFLLKPWLGNACRFEPTCSAYALQALQDHGALRGSVLSTARLLRCHPWCDGGCDPVPPAGSGLFTSLFSRATHPAAPCPLARRADLNPGAPCGTTTTTVTPP